MELLQDDYYYQKLLPLVICDATREICLCQQKKVLQNGVAIDAADVVAGWSVTCSAAQKRCCMRRRLASVWILGLISRNSWGLTSLSKWVVFFSVWFHAILYRVDTTSYLVCLLDESTSFRRDTLYSRSLHCDY